MLFGAVPVVESTFNQMGREVVSTEKKGFGGLVELTAMST
jgi:hypothetical protein